MSTHAQFAVFRGGLKIQSAGEFVIEREVAYVNGGVDHRRIQRARPCSVKSARPSIGKVVQMNLANPRYVEIFPDQVKPKAARRRRIGGTAGNNRISCE